MTWALDVLIVDGDLRDERGHPATYCRAVTGELAKRGLRFATLAGAGVGPKLMGQLHASPVFPHGKQPLGAPAGGRVAALVEAVAASASFLKAYLRWKRRHDLQALLVFAPTVAHRLLPGWAGVVRSLPRGSTVVLFLRLPTAPAVGGRVKPGAAWTVWMRVSFAALRLAGRGRNVRLVTDSEQLAAEYALLVPLPVEVVPIPHTSLAGVVRNRPAAVTRAVSLGDAREGKGFLVLAAAAERLFLDGHLENIHLLIQSSASPLAGKEVQAALRRLIELHHPHVELVEGPLDAPAYEQLLSAAHVVVLPYQRAVYAGGTSGPFTEALAAGRPVIVTEGTWMSAQLRRHGAGITVPDGDASALAGALLELHRRRKELIPAAVAAAPAWRFRHNAAALCDAILGLAEQR